MSAALAQNSTFSFKGVNYTATSVSVESPQAEVVNMTPATGAVGEVLMRETGDFLSPGRATIECFGFQAVPKNLAAQRGLLSFATQLGTLQTQAICESATVEGRVGDLLRLRLSFVLTDS